jgi:putative SOS response-associated peptidase YedK
LPAETHTVAARRLPEPDERRHVQRLRTTYQSQADLPVADDIRIGNTGPVIRPAGNGVELAQMSFGFPPKGRGGPVFNFRSEGRHFGDSRRCLIPASAFFEFTGSKYPKTKHRFTLNGAPFLGVAGLWREGEGNQPPAFTMLTTAPGPDIEPYHDRQVVVLTPERWADWLWLTRPETELLRPLPKGSLAVETVRKGADQLQAEQA